MGKTSRKTKAKKKDFNKVKFKAGKKKPLANNVTKTEFKAQSIYVSTQGFRNAQNESSSDSAKPQASLKECLPRLKHHAPTPRYQALKKIKDIFLSTTNPLVYFPYEVLEKVYRTISDQDSEVRKACIELLQIMFAEFPSKEMKHHFAVMVKYLKCAMLNPSKAVQRDSSKVLDLILDHYSDLIDTTYSYEMLSISLDIVSFKTQANNNNSPRVLAIKSNESSLSWYLTIFAQIHRLLMASNPSKPRNYDNPAKIHTFHMWNSWEGLARSIRPHNPYWQSNRLKEYCPKHDKVVTQDDLQGLTQQIYSLLLQSWREVTLSDSNFTGEYTSSIMRIVVQISIQLVQYLLRSTTGLSATKFIHNEFLKSFEKCFFDDFPFQPFSDDNETKKKQRWRRKGKTNEKSLVKGHFKKNLTLLNIGVCQLYTVVHQRSKEHLKKGHKHTADQQVLLDMTDFIVDYLSTTSIAELLHKNDVNEGDMLQQSLDLCDKLIELGDQDVCQPLISAMLKQYRKYRHIEKGLPFIHFVYHSYENDYITPIEGHSFYEYFATVLDELMNYLKIMKDSRVEGKCILSDRKNIIFRHFDFNFRIIQHAHVKLEPVYLQQIPGKLYQLFDLMMSPGLFCLHDAKCFDCLQCQNELTHVSLGHVKVYDKALMMKMSAYAISPQSNVQVMNTVAYTFEDACSQKPATKAIMDNMTLTQCYFYYILLGGIREQHETNTAPVTDSDLSRIGDSCDFVLRMWMRMPHDEKTRVNERLAYYYDVFYGAKSSQYPRSWIGFLRVFIFIQTQPYASEFTKYHEGIARFLAKILKYGVDGKFETLLTSAYKVFKADLDLRCVCLQHLINDEDTLSTLLELAKRPDFCKAMSKQKTSNHIITSLRHLMPNNEEPSERKRLSDTVIAILENNASSHTEQKKKKKKNLKRKLVNGAT